MPRQLLLSHGAMHALIGGLLVLVLARGGGGGGGVGIYSEEENLFHTEI